MVDIVIVTHNALTKLKSCLRSIPKYTNPASYQLIIVNNASTDGTREYLNKVRLPNCRISHLSQNMGFSGGANHALKQLRAPYAVFLDDDTRVTKNWLTDLLKTAKKSKKIGMVGCKLVYPNNRIFFCEARLGPLRTLFIKDNDRGQADYIKEVDLIAGACFVMPLKVIKEIGPFDERFFPSQYEDWDYCIRVREAGYKIIYNGLVPVIHDNLFRAGGLKGFEINKKRFLKKWRRILPRYPRPDSSVADKMMARALKLVTAKKYPEALKICGRLEKIEPKWVELWLLSLIHVRMKQYRKAMPLLQELLLRHPNSYSAKNFLTLCQRELKHQKNAKRSTKEMMGAVLEHLHKKRTRGRPAPL